MFYCDYSILISFSHFCCCYIWQKCGRWNKIQLNCNLFWSIEIISTRYDCLFVLSFSLRTFFHFLLYFKQFRANQNFDTFFSINNCHVILKEYTQQFNKHTHVECINSLRIVHNSIQFQPPTIDFGLIVCRLIVHSFMSSFLVYAWYSHSVKLVVFA